MGGGAWAPLWRRRRGAGAIAAWGVLLLGAYLYSWAPELTLVVVPVLLVEGVVFWSMRRREARLIAAAGGRGFSVPPAATSLPRELADLPLPIGRVSHVFHRRVDEIGIWTFSAPHPTETTVSVAAVAFDLGEAVLPSFEVRRAHGGDRASTGRWLVLGNDNLAVQRIFSPEAQRLFVELGGDWEVVGRGRWLVVYRLGRSTRGADLKARNFDTTIDTAARIVTALTGR